MNKRIVKKHKNLAAKIHECAFGKNKGKNPYYTWKRSNFIMYLMHKYYGIHYYHEENDTKADKFCFW